MEKPRLLISASDPGAAFHICEVVRHAGGAGVMELILLAGPPALAIFEQAGFSVHPFASGRVGQQDSNSVSSILEEAASLIATFAPDAILVGLSCPDRGIDEALIAQSGNIPTYAIQDFWGDVNPGFGKLPDTYFVLDEMAAKLTRLRAPSSRIVVVGSARHAAMAQLDPASLRKGFRSLINATPLGVVAVFFGQPLWDLPGYGVTLSKTAGAFARVSPGATLLYRAHPKESLQERHKALDCLTGSNLLVSEDKMSLVESPLCGADLLFTCFSSCGLDLACLNCSSTIPLGALICLLCEGDVRQLYCDTSHLEDMPLSTMGLTTTIWQDDAIESAIRIALTESERERIWRSAKDKIIASSCAAERIVNVIAEDLLRNAAEAKFSECNFAHGK